MDRRALSDLYAAAYDTVSANRNVVAGDRARSYDRGGMDSGGRAVGREEKTEHAGEVEDRIRALERRAFRLCDEVGGDDCGCGRGRAQRGGVFCSGGENNCAGAGRFDRHRREDLNLPVTAKLESQLRSQFLQVHPIAPCPVYASSMVTWLRNRRVGRAVLLLLAQAKRLSVILNGAR